MSKRKFDGSKVYHSPDGRMVLFWHPPAVYGQWTFSPFTVDGHTYTCAEQWMMAEKARLFGDAKVEREILQSGHDPRKHKRLGRMVSNFDEKAWSANCVDIVVRGNVHKFRQNPEMLKELLATGDKLLVEASPRDTIWGIGYSAGNPRAFDQSTWRGSNLLGKALMRAREILREEAKTQAQASADAPAAIAKVATEGEPEKLPAPKELAGKDDAKLATGAAGTPGKEPSGGPVRKVPRVDGQSGEGEPALAVVSTGE